MDVHFESMAGEMLANIGALDLVLLAAFVGDDDDFDSAVFTDERYSVRNRARRPGVPNPRTRSFTEAWWQ